MSDPRSPFNDQGHFGPTLPKNDRIDTRSPSPDLSAYPTPNLNLGGSLLRFQLPEGENGISHDLDEIPEGSTYKNPQGHGISHTGNIENHANIQHSNVHFAQEIQSPASVHFSLMNHSPAHAHFSQQSPFDDPIDKFSKPQSPFLSQTFELSDSTSDVYDFSEDQKHADQLNPQRSSTVMKRHRWGTTRNKHGKPKKENISRSKTLKGLLLPRQGPSRRSSTRHASRNASRSGSDGPSRMGLIRKPRTIEEDIIDDYSGNHHNEEDAEEDQDEEPKDPADRKHEKRTITFNRPLPEEFLDPETGKPMTEYLRNKIRTTKYTPLSFIPKNLANQFFKNVANLYFLALIILGAFDIFGVPSPVLAAVPLIVICAITAIKDAIEDSRRTVTDMEVNNQYSHILGNVSGENSYVNYNVNDEKISLWRRFKKANSRLLFKIINAIKNNLTKEARAKKAREEAEETSHARKSFESNIMDFATPRNSMESKADGRTVKFHRKYWKDVRVGDVLRIYNNEELPADMIILSTSDEDNCCYVETKNLDGETNLKVKQALKYGAHITRAGDMMSREFTVESEGPHPNLYLYQGNLINHRSEKGTEEEPIAAEEAVTINNLLLRGCSLRNTQWVIGVVIFTGADTKIMLNAGITPTKQLRISRELNYYIIMNFILLFVVCLVSGLVNGVYYRRKGTSRDFYEFGTIASTPAISGLLDFFVALILYQSLVPISLYITIEIIKTAQVFFIYSDIAMYYERLDYPCTPKSWSISDDLGQIEYIFSDKTGTLTQNLMEFKKCTIQGVLYGKAYTEALAGLRKRQGVDVEQEGRAERERIAEDRAKMIELLNASTGNDLYNDELTFISLDFVKDLEGASGEKQKEHNAQFMLLLALCHSVLVEEDKKDPRKLALKAQSPDEAALVGTARACGYEFNANTKKGVVVNIKGTDKEYQVLNTLEFNSTRKRMSAIIKIPGENGAEPKALLICKGADLIIYGRLSKTANDRKLLDTTSAHLEEYATEGLRTLCIAQRELSWSQYLKWNQKHQQAASSLDDREAKMEAVADSIERELVLLGGTAIEDRLQDGVPDAIQLLAQAGIKLWVLTGDKVETAINIGFSCNLLGNDMELLLIKTDLTPDEVKEYQVDNYDTLSAPLLIDYLISHFLATRFGRTGSIEELEEAMLDHSPPGEGFGVVVDGEALKLALLNPDTKRKFLLLCKQCKAVLCCRVSPAQKAAVVKLVKQTLDVMTLAIGDGSNDVAMIQAADVGVGIAGEEGRQAVMSSDYAVGQFRYLAKLLVVHGRWSYKRFSEMIPSFFYKNVIFTFALFWYGAFNDFDGTYLFEFTYLTFYNLAFTSLAVIFLGVLDQDISAKASLLVPQVYRSGIFRSEWTEKKFWVYMVDALYQSVISFFFPYCLYRTGFVGMSGRVMDHRFWMGIMVAGTLCIACNLYIFVHQYRWDWLSGLIIAISILIFFGWTGIWTLVVGLGEFFKAAAEVFGCAPFWACLFIGILVCLLPRLFYDFVQKLHWPSDVDIIRECELRGDFDAYPDNYDPTDPNRAKISDYSRISISQAQQPTKSAGSSSSSYNNPTPPMTGEIPKDGNSANHSKYSIFTPPNNNTTESFLDATVVENESLHELPTRRRKSVIDVFKRKRGSILDSDHSASADSLQTEDIAMHVFNENQNAAKRALEEVKRLSLL